MPIRPTKLTKTYEPLYKSLLELTMQKQIAIQMRFWDLLTIEQIANRLHLTWDEADRLIETTLCELKFKLKTKNWSAHCAA